MTKYVVRVTCWQEFEVEAESKDEAENLCKAGDYMDEGLISIDWVLEC